MEQINFQQTIERLRDTGFSPVPNTVNISIPDAKNVLWAGIKYFTGEKAQWLPEYLADKQSRTRSFMLW